MSCFAPDLDCPATYLNRNPFYPLNLAEVPKNLKIDWAFANLNYDKGSRREGLSFIFSNQHYFLSGKIKPQSTELKNSCNSHLYISFEVLKQSFPNLIKMSILHDSRSKYHAWPEQ